MQQAMEFLIPWLTLVVIFIPMRHLERWIHRHLYGVGWLMTQDRQLATLFYYLILLPGVFLHEFIQWVFAGTFSLKLSKIDIWPRAQTDGTLRLDFVKLAGKNTNTALTRAYEIAPVLGGIAVVLYISQRMFRAGNIVVALGTADLTLVLWAFETTLATPDFWLWLYLLFAIGNAMLPTTVEQQTRSLAIRIGGGLTALLLTFSIIAGDNAFVVLEPITRLINLLATAFAVIIVLDLLVVALLAFLERLLERATGRKVRYSTQQPVRTPAPEPGSEAILSQDQAPERITARRLPIPPPPKGVRKASPHPTASISGRQSPLPGHLNTQHAEAQLQARTATFRPVVAIQPDTESSTTEGASHPADLAAKGLPEELRPGSTAGADASSMISWSTKPETNTAPEENGPDELYYEDIEDIP